MRFDLVITCSEPPLPLGRTRIDQVRFEAFGGVGPNQRCTETYLAFYPRMSTGPRPATRPTTSWQAAFDMYFGTG